jgi:hypothetical protein
MNTDLDKRIKESYESDDVLLDGIIDETKYFKNGYRILWILKEPYDNS